MESTLSIGEVAERAGLTTSALRFYERQALISAERSAGGQRRYRRDVLRRVAFIRVAFEQGNPLLEAIDVARASHAGPWSRKESVVP